MPYISKNKNKKNEYGDHYQYSEKNIMKYQDINSNYNKYSKKKLFSIIIACVLSILFALTGTALIYFDSLVNSINYEASTSQDQDPESVKLYNTTEKDPSLLKDPKVLNIMLFGVDDQSRHDEVGGTDSMILLSLDNRHKKIKLTSIMRDIWVKIPGYGEEKLNAAFSFGGPNLAVSTIEKLFGVNIDRYALVHFDGFIKIIDAIGGLDLNLTAEEIKMINIKINGGVENYKGKSKNDLPEKDGITHLDGVHTLMNATDRYTSGDDYGRTQRQRKIINAFIEKTKTLSLPQIISMASNVGSSITTNLKKSEVTKLIQNSLGYTKYSVSEFRLPEDNNHSNVTEKNGALALEINDMPLSRYNLAKFIYEDSIKIK